jgi:hypothetical protein
MGATLLTTVPATISRSACLGEALNITPNLSKSKREAAVCIISIAQQASPMVTGQRAFLLPQLKSSSTVVKTKPFEFKLAIIAPPQGLKIITCTIGFSSSVLHDETIKIVAS